LVHATLSIPLLIKFLLLVVCVYLKDVQLHFSRSSRVVRIRAFSGEGDVEEEASSFGAAAKPASGKSSSKEKKKSGTIRRSAPQQPLIQAPGDPQAQQIETAYVASLSFLGLLIFVEGLALAASGSYFPALCLEILAVAADGSFGCP
jgi:hypothetical protein